MREKITDYKVVPISTLASSALSVNKLIKEGWQPYGFPVMGNPDPINPTFIQAMVKYYNPNELIDN